MNVFKRSFAIAFLFYTMLVMVFIFLHINLSSRLNVTALLFFVQICEGH